MREQKEYNREKMKTLRVLLGLSLREIAEEMRTTKQTISNIETGKSKNTMALEFYERVLAERLVNIEISKRSKICQAIKILYGEYPTV